MQLPRHISTCIIRLKVKITIHLATKGPHEYSGRILHANMQFSTALMMLARHVCVGNKRGMKHGNI